MIKKYRPKIFIEAVKFTGNVSEIKAFVNKKISEYKDEIRIPADPSGIGTFNVRIGDYVIKEEQVVEEDKDNHDYKEAKGENKQMELKDTITLMTSDDYKERFKAEYYQVKIRYEKLLAMIEKWEKGELTFTPTCPRETYNFQLRAMKEYLDILVIRAKIESIDLGE